MGNNAISPETITALFEGLRRVQEPKGYFFNADTAFAKELLAEMLVLKERYGYMACPCRLANGTRENDKDIICPCDYREADIKEFGSCYCGLYVTQEWNEGRCPHEPLPDRRPPEKILW